MEVVEVLGGQLTLGQPFTGVEDFAQIIRKGLPTGAITSLAAALGIGSGALSRKLGIPQRTLTRRLSEGSRLTPAESDRAFRMARIFSLAVELIGDKQNAIHWLKAPNRALGGEIPIDQLDTDAGSRMVEDILGRIAYGVYS